jgi:type I restriction enzyme R subunit
MVKATIIKTSNRPSLGVDLNHAIQQLISRSISTDGEVINVFAMAGLPNPDISLISEQFLREVRQIPQKNVAANCSPNFSMGKSGASANITWYKGSNSASCSNRLWRNIKTEALTTLEVIEELIRIAQELQALQQRSHQLQLQ